MRVKHQTRLLAVFTLCPLESGRTLEDVVSFLNTEFNRRWVWFAVYADAGE